jgi:hypothetical protein
VSEFWSQREWEDWSNELAMILPEDAECWPGVNPEGAQESIITAALRYLVGVEAQQRAEDDDDEPCLCGTGFTCLARAHPGLDAPA